ncbi:hydrogenase formation protein HypD [Sporolactobacillus laevolacticus]|uniref:Hydrogenase formation protein HypD n=1 Tax=Sporolactobacillus laevolacticus DSM 442 TaxID=1395513 RepID=V6IW94_9BACL|nr:hydrogenase formation protein HypD [Sporolactobacillus laevolacticus]EST11563.1 hydrogenase formation protein HypD [Sporolactobacillus laevolacticus DSM 442]
MRTLFEPKDSAVARELAQKVIKLADRCKEKTGVTPAFMEVCGSHTMALARSGIKLILQDHVRLLSGPGCPVCVTDQKQIDAMIEVAEAQNRIVCTFGDMMRVPGSKRSLLSAKTEGRDVRIVYSPLDAVRIAQENPDREVVFLGVGFETTVPVLAAALQLAELKQVENFSMWATTKLVQPVLRTLLSVKKVKIHGFLLPGHVSIVLGEQAYQFLADEFHMPGVITGFETVEMLSGIYKLLQMVLNDQPAILNNYKSVVRPDGNPIAQKIMNEFFTPCDETWRGMGMIPQSGLDIRDQYSHLNAKKKFNVTVGEPKKTLCRCGDMICGLATPDECILFGKACTPIHPVGPCMVSDEGSCSAYYAYMRKEG